MFTGLAQLRLDSRESSYVRLGVNLIEEAAAVLFREDTGETPRLLLQRLHILNLYD
jgi:hypothetical protein